MKRTLIMAAAIVLSITNALAQGYITFGNTTVPPPYRLYFIDGTSTNMIGTASTALGLGPGSVRIQLLVGANGAAASTMVPVTAALNGTQLVTNSTATSTLAQGTFSGYTSPLPTGYAWSDGLSPIQFLYAMWRISTGVTSYSEWASFGGDNWNEFGNLGYSSIITGYMPGHGTVVAPQTFGSGSSQTPFLAIIIPEPGTFALAGLGISALLLFHRRK